jgi:DNA repair exonuclease SbcCD ATPase subunit
MKINKLKIKNILGIQEINFEPGNITIIKGKSGSGKTSILEALQRSITGKSERDCFVNTATDEKGEVYLVIDDNINLIKKYNQNGKTTTKLTNNDLTVKSSGTYLKSLVNELQLNPIDLIKMPDKELTELILNLIDIKIDDSIIEKIGINIDNNRHGLKVCEELETIIYDKRTEINREIKLIDGEIEGYKDKIPAGYNIETAKGIDLKIIFEKISDGNKINSNIQKAQNIISESETKIKSIKDKADIEINNLLQKIKDIKNKANIDIEKEKELTTNAEKYVSETKEINIAELENIYKEKEEYKSYIKIAEELENKKVENNRKKEESETLSKKLDFVRKLPGELLEKADMPVDNITYKEGKININGRPIINLSGGERIKFVMDIVKKISGDLKLILINGFESLNEDEQKHFIENCKDDGFQYFITKTCDEELNILDAETGEILDK